MRARQTNDSSFSENTYGILKRLSVIRAWLSAHQPKGRLRILDYGCGTGNHLTIPLAQDGHELLGVDLHHESIRLARERHRMKNLSFRVATVNDLVRERLQFDAIVCSEVLEHLEDPSGFLMSLKKLLAVEGVVVITTPNGYGSYEMLCRVARLMSKIGIHQLFQAALGKSKRMCDDANAGFLNHDSVHVQFFGLKRLDAIFRESGLSILDRRARTLLCGPYLDVIFDVLPFQPTLLRINSRAADVLPFACSADWMFLLQHRSA